MWRGRKFGGIWSSASLYCCVLTLSYQRGVHRIGSGGLALCTWVVSWWFHALQLRVKLGVDQVLLYIFHIPLCIFCSLLWILVALDGWENYAPKLFVWPINVSIYLNFLNPWDNISLIIVDKVINLSSGREIRNLLVSKILPRRIFNFSSPNYVSSLVMDIKYFLCMCSFLFNGLPKMFMAKDDSSCAILLLLLMLTHTPILLSISTSTIAYDCRTLMMRGFFG